MSFGGPDPMRGDVIFRIASMTKPITAVPLMVQPGAQWLYTVGCLWTIGCTYLSSGPAVGRGAIAGITKNIEFRTKGQIAREQKHYYAG